MDRWQIILIAVIASVVWMVYKRATGKSKSTSSRVMPRRQSAEAWFHEVQGKVADLEAGVKAEREERWAKMEEAEQLSFSDAFLEQTFGGATIARYTNEEKLQLGKAQYLIEPDPISGSQT